MEAVPPRKMSIPSLEVHAPPPRKNSGSNTTGLLAPDMNSPKAHPRRNSRSMSIPHMDAMTFPRRNSRAMSISSSTLTGRVFVIAMDGSDAAAFAFETYLTTLKNAGDQVILVFCQDVEGIQHNHWQEGVYTVGFNKDACAEKIRKQQEEKTSVLLPYFDKLTEIGISCKTMVVATKQIGEGIVNTALEQKACLIIMGTRGRSKILRTLGGSVVDWVIQHSHIPVVVCRKPSDYTPSEDLQQ